MKDADRPTDQEKSNPPKPVDPSSAVASGDVTIGNIRTGDVLGNALITGGNRIITVTGATMSGNTDSTKSATTAGRASSAAKDILMLSKKIGAATDELSKLVNSRNREELSSEQALGRIADAVRLNLGQLQLNMEQARRKSSQFFRTTMVFSGIAFAIILGGIGLMLASLVTVGIVTTAASIIPQAGALLLSNRGGRPKRAKTYASVLHAMIESDCICSVAACI